jgi:hypothetical protein
VRVNITRRCINGRMWKVRPCAPLNEERVEKTREFIDGQRELRERKEKLGEKGGELHG